MYEATTKENAKWSFQVPPEVPAECDIVETVDCDAVVVGGGIGGFSAACRLRELGADVVLIEKSASYSGRGGHFGVADSSLMEENGIKNDLKEIARQWIAISGNNVVGKAADGSEFTLIPYYRWCNRHGGAMRVWFPYAAPLPTPTEGILYQEIKK